MLLAVPNKGRLVEPTMRMLDAVGIRPLASDDRALVLPTSWQELHLVRARPEDIPSIVGWGSVALGVTGYDYVVESGVEVETIAQLGFGRGRLVVAVPRGSGVRSVAELPSGTRVATKYANIAYRYFGELGLRVRVVKVSGSVEVMPFLGVADAVMDIVSTGTTLSVHGLVPIETVLETEAVLVARRGLGGEERYVADKLATLISSVRNAAGKKLLLVNVPDEVLDTVVKSLPAMEGPTVARVASGRAMWEVITVVPEEEIPDIVMRLKSLGAKDIVITPIEKVVQ